MVEEESRRVQEEDSFDGSRYTVHAYALQASVEKVTVLRGVVKYTDLDFTLPTSEGASKVYKLALLYDKYFEYAEILAAQGLVKEATEYLKLIPRAYTGSAFDSGAKGEVIDCIGRVVDTYSCDQGPCKSESARFCVVYASGHHCKDGGPQSRRAIPAAPTLIPACTAVPSTRTARVCPTGKACSPQSTWTVTSGYAACH